MSFLVLNNSDDLALNEAALDRVFVGYYSTPSLAFDSSGHIVSFNVLAQELFGLPDQSSRIHLDTIVSSADLQEVSSFADSILDGKSSYFTSQVNLIGKDSSEFLSSIVISKHNIENSNIFILQAIPIQAGTQLSKFSSLAEERWSYALESAGQGVWESDLVTNTVHYSPTWFKLRGYDPDDVVDSSREAWLSRIHPMDRDRVLNHIQKAEKNEKHVFEYRERNKAGQYIWIQSRGSPSYFDENNNPLRIVGTDTDITEFKRAQHLSDALSRRLELALSISGVGVFEVNLSTLDMALDERLKYIFGFSSEKYTYEDFLSVVHPDDLLEVTSVNIAVQSSNNHSSVFRIVRSDGEVRTIKSNASYYEAEDGTPYMIGTNWDITDDVILQQELINSKTLAEARYSELEIAKEKIEVLALQDSLTGLYNRRKFDDFIHSVIDPISVLHIDLDHFKEVNDSHGHPAGDAVLRHTSFVLRNACLESDHIFRVGGDEFFVIRKNSSAEDMEYLAKSITNSLSTPLKFKGSTIIIGSSMGIATAPSGKKDADKILSDADTALYKAKQTGRGKYAVFSRQMRNELDQIKKTNDEIIEAVRSQQFSPYYQPVVNARTRNISSVEALARWNHPEMGVLPPSAFISPTDDLHLLGDIDSIILDKAVCDFNRWRSEGVPISSISVNISFRRLQDEKLIDMLRLLPFEPGTLNFELLESIFLDDAEDRFSKNLQGIKELGIGIDIDDFGTGHTSFLSLFKLRPRRFKIDRELVSPILDNPESRSIIKSMIGIGRTLGLKVVAEGVETLEHADMLRKLGCDYLQGYAFSAPMPAEEVAQWAIAHAPRRK